MEQTHIKSFGLRLVLARHVITPRDLLSFGESVSSQKLVIHGVHLLALFQPFATFKQLMIEVRPVEIIEPHTD